MPFKKVDDEDDERSRQQEQECMDGQSDATSCHQLGEHLAIVRREMERATAVWDKNCADKQFSPSCYELGRKYPGSLRALLCWLTHVMAVVGSGVKRSSAKAMKCFDTACKGNHLPACFHMGWLLLDVPYPLVQNKRMGSHALDKACMGGMPEACSVLGMELIRQDGKGALERDPGWARDLLEKGCGDSHGPSCFNLAVMYRHGDTGVPSDEKKFEHYKKRTEELVETYGGSNLKPPGDGS